VLARAILLGPQRHVPIVAPALARLLPGRGSAIALVSAGWEEREGEDGEFRDHVQRPVHNLELWARVERIFERDPELLLAMRERHDTLRRAQELYRLRLSGLVAAATALLSASGDPRLLEPERASALDMLALLDRDHMARIAELHAEFAARWRPAERREVQRHRQELAAILQDCDCLCIAGGHVGVLLHRLALFDVVPAFGDRPVIAWSAGAMVLAERIVLYDDDGSAGAPAEVMEAGFRALPGIVPLPHGKKRLRLHDAVNVQLFARRFAPAVCALLGDGDRLDWDGRRFRASPGAQRLCADGALAEIGQWKVVP